MDINSENLKHTSARWFDSDDPTNRRLAVNIHNGVCTVIRRDDPSDVWSPPIRMFLSASVDTK